MAICFFLMCNLEQFNSLDWVTYDDQDERAPDTTPSSTTYIALSDDNPTPQDTHPVDHDNIHGD